MATQPTIYVAVATEDLSIADVILAHLRDHGYHCIDRTHVPNLLDYATDLHGTLSECDLIVLIDSHAFRQEHPNYELQYAQELSKPLIVISLHQKVDESRSTWRVRLFDFTNPRRRNWQHVIETIVMLIDETTGADDDFFLM